MDGSNSNQGNQNNQNQGKQNAQQHNQNQAKPALSWSQPATSSNTTPNKPALKATEPVDLQDDSTGRVIGIIVGVIIVFALIAWGIVTLHKNSGTSDVSTTTSEALTGDEASTSETAQADTQTAPQTPAATETTESTAPAAAATTEPAATAPAGSASFTVPATQDAGSQVAVTDLLLSAPTWIIVYESADGSTPGRILGAGLFFAGDKTGTVSLLRATVSGKTYLVSAALDNGNKSFVKADEKYVIDATTGTQVWMKFKTR